ncbi:hypothetical protein K3495_g337 [Podosphaera aphanis]|nr:hypothetical protein K3495_g337 [Podosphaera aphanis]
MAPDDAVQHTGGKVIALEGDCDIISTQLHLLPPSTNILTFPPFQKVFSKHSDPSNFDPRVFINEVHTAYAQRIQDAQNFLEGSSDSNPRLVFMNGGSIRAQTICIESICEHITAGQIGAAEALFNNLVKDGIAGLTRNHDDEDLPKNFSKNRTRTKSISRLLDSTATDTASQTATPELEGTCDSSTQEKGPVDEAPDFKTSSPAASDLAIRRWTFETFPEDISSLASSLKISSYINEERSQNKTSNVAETPSNYTSMLPSETSIELSPTAALHGRKSENKTRRSKSFDYKPESRIGYRSVNSSRLYQSKRENRLSLKELKDSTCEDSACNVDTQSAFWKAYQTTIIRNPTITTDEADFEKAEPYPTIKSTDTDTDTDIQSFVPVFDPLEDYVIHVTGGMTDVILDTVLRSYLNRKNPASRNQINSIPITPFRASQILKSIAGDKSSISIDDDNPSNNKRKTYNSHATLKYPSNSDHDESSPPPKEYQSTSSSATSTNEKFLSFVPENSSNSIAVHNCLRRFLSNYFPAGKYGFSQYRHVISTEADRLWKPVFKNSDISKGEILETTVDLIIALGSDDNNKIDLTKQISGMIEQLGCKKDGEHRSSKLDIRYLIAQILQNPRAITSGYDSFDPLSEPSLTATLLIPQLETYLANNTSTNLLVLHFLHSHLPIVFALRDLMSSSLFKIAGITNGPSTESSLISCPPSPLTPNPLSNDAVASRNRIRGHSTKGSVASGHGTLRTITSNPLSPANTISLTPTMAQSDYLLPNSATDVEIGNFISAIQKTLLEKSAFYTPEPEPEPKTIIQVVEKYLPAPTPALSFTTTQSRPTSQHRPSTREGMTTQEDYFNPKSKRLSKVSQLTRNSSISRPPSEFRPKHNYSNSIASSRRTFVSKLTVDDVDNWENFEICDDDSDFDDFDRMIMGRRMAAMVMSGCLVGATYGEEAVRERGIASKRKALKWLGLA